MIAKVTIEVPFSTLMDAMSQIFFRKMTTGYLDADEFCEADADKLEAYAGVIRMLLKEKE